jgi:hypothetical protein
MRARTHTCTHTHTHHTKHTTHKHKHTHTTHTQTPHTHYTTPHQTHHHTTHTPPHTHTHTRHKKVCSRTKCQNLNVYFDFKYLSFKHILSTEMYILKSFKHILILKLKFVERPTEGKFHGKDLSRKIRIKIVRRVPRSYPLRVKKSDFIKHSHSHRSLLDIKDAKSTESVCWYKNEWVTGWATAFLSVINYSDRS